MFILGGSNKFFIRPDPWVCLYVGFLKHSKAKTNILRDAKYILGIEIKDGLLNEMKTQYPGLTLTHLYKYEFYECLTNIQMEVDAFYAMK